MTDPSDPGSVEALAEKLLALVLERGDPRLAGQPYRAVAERFCQRPAKQLLRSRTFDDATLPATADEIAAEALQRGHLIEIGRLLDELEDRGTTDRIVIEELRTVLKRYRKDLTIDDPADWVDSWYRAEQERRRSSSGIRSDRLREQLDHLTNLIYNDPKIVGLIWTLARGRVDADEIQQGAAEKILEHFIKVDRLGSAGLPVEPGNERGYVKTALRNQFLDLLGLNREIPMGPIADPVDGGGSGPLAVLPAPEPDPNIRPHVLHLIARIQERSFAAPGILGPAYGAQRLGTSNANAVRLIGRRFAQASLFTAWQRRAGGLVSPGMIEAMEAPAEADDGHWLRPPVNHALGVLVPGWSTHYGDRLPSDSDDVAGVRDGTEASDRTFLLRDCVGQSDSRRADDPHGDESVRRHGVAGLLRLIYGDLFDGAGEGGR